MRTMRCDDLTTRLRKGTSPAARVVPLLLTRRPTAPAVPGPSVYSPCTARRPRSGPFGTGSALSTCGPCGRAPESTGTSGGPRQVAGTRVEGTFPDVSELGHSSLVRDALVDLQTLSLLPPCDRHPGTARPRRHWQRRPTCPRQDGAAVVGRLSLGPHRRRLCLLRPSGAWASSPRKFRWRSRFGRRVRRWRWSGPGWRRRGSGG